MVVVAHDTNYIFLFRFRFDELFPCVPYTKLTDEVVIDKLRGSEAYDQFPIAMFSEKFIGKIKSTFAQKTFKDRVDVLYDLCRAEYDNTNINKYAVIDTAKRKNMSYFMQIDRERMIKETLKKFNK